MLTGMTSRRAAICGIRRSLTSAPSSDSRGRPAFYHQRVRDSRRIWPELQPGRNRDHRQRERQSRAHGFAKLQPEPAHVAQPRHCVRRFRAMCTRCLDIRRIRTPSSASAQRTAHHEPGGRDRLPHATCPRCTRSTIRWIRRPTSAPVHLYAGYQGSAAPHYFHYDENAVAAVQGIPLNPQVNSVNFFDNNGHATTTPCSPD